MLNRHRKSAHGCFGKLKISTMEAVIRGCNDFIWEDSTRIGDLNDALFTIDTVRLPMEDIIFSLKLSILHAANDIFAGGGVPRAISVSFGFLNEPGAELLISLNVAIDEISNALKMMVSKKHTSFGFNENVVTIAIVGQAVRDRARISDSGSVYLLDVCGDPPVGDEGMFEAWLLARLKNRTMLAKLEGLALKDISGDGLAGALWQLSEREDRSISIALNSLPPISAGAPLDNCDLDRNYANFSDRISGFKGKKNNSKSRYSLFKPEFFGPIVGMGSIANEYNIGEIIEIGKFEQTLSGVELSIS